MTGTGRVRMRLAAAVLAAAALAGCGSELDTGERRGAVTGLFGAAARSVLPARAAPPAAPPSRTAIDASTVPVVIVGVELTGGSAPLLQVARNGDVQVFATTNGVTVALRDGMLVATRGLGPDLMTSDPPRAADLRDGSGTYVRTYDHLGGTSETVRTVVDCVLEPAGTETLDLYGLTVPTTVVFEMCGAPGIVTEGRYWFDGTGRLRQSRQWGGPLMGYLTLTDPMR